MLIQIFSLIFFLFCFFFFFFFFFFFCILILFKSSCSQHSDIHTYACICNTVSLFFFFFFVLFLLFLYFILATSRGQTVIFHDDERQCKYRIYCVLPSGQLSIFTRITFLKLIINNLISFFFSLFLILSFSENANEE